MRVLITGGCGFVGANVCDHFLHQGKHGIVVLDNLTAGSPTYLTDVGRKHGVDIPVMEGDIRDERTVREALRGVDAIVHLAARSGIPDSLKDPVATFDVNVAGTLNLLEGARAAGVRRFVLASSSAAIGNHEPPVDEMLPPRPLSPYGASKLAAEGLCSAYYGSFGFSSVALRFGNVYGPYSDHKTSVVARFRRLIAEGLPLTVYGDGDQTRDFVHAADVASAVGLALEYEPQSADDLVFQVGSGRATTINELIAMISEICQEQTGKRPITQSEPPRAADVRHALLDITRARDELGFEPVTTLRDGLRSMWAS